MSLRYAESKKRSKSACLPDAPASDHYLLPYYRNWWTQAEDPYQKSWLVEANYDFEPKDILIKFMFRNGVPPCTGCAAQWPHETP